MNRRVSAVRRGIDRLTILAVVATIAIVVVRWFRHREHGITRAVPAVSAALLNDSTMPMPSGVRLSRLERYDMAASGITTGDTSAVVTLIVFLDYGCGWCSVFDSTVELVREHYPDLVRIVYKPILLDSLNSELLDVAAGSYCAQDLHSFLAYHRAVLSHQGWLADRNAWNRIAGTVPALDDRTLRRCVLGERYRARIRQNTREAVALGFMSTPSSIVGRRPIVGNASYGLLDSLVTLALSDNRGLTH